MPHESTPVMLIRHAESLWNRQNRFTGWADPPLTEAGVAEAARAGAWLRSSGYHFDVAFSSRLERARHTLTILRDHVGQRELQVLEDWRLNERHYGALQGIDKRHATAMAGALQVWRWRRGYADRAAPLSADDPAHPLNDPRYADVDRRRLPAVESLADTRARVMAFWREQVTPRIRRGERMLISAHGNTLRALLMDLAGMSVDQVEAFEIPTATPILYRFDRSGRPRDWCYPALDPDSRKTA